MITILSTEIKKFTHIIHIADLHIRLNKRGEEYREVFDTLYEEIKQSPSTTLVALLGDIFHSKVDLSPECIQLASELFKKISDIRPLILIAGNHDANLSNKSRLDSLTPVVNALNNSNVYYLKTTGLYGFGNILFNNMCVFDSSDVYIKGKDIPSVYKNQYEHIIALFHGAVDGACTDMGHRIENPNIMVPLFDHHHIALLGDIHLAQTIQDYDPDYNKSHVRFCGSLIMQNYGENLKGHGYSLWDLSDYSYTHHEINNNYGYFTIEINKGVLVTSLNNIPKKVRLRIKCYETIASEVKSIVSDIRNISEIIEIAHVRMDKEIDKTDIISLCSDVILADLSNVDYQNNLISEFLDKKLAIKDQSKINDILNINRSTNLIIKKDDFIHNLKWKPIKFEFSNMFTYGENNVIDFSQMSGVYGIFGPNKTGKSSILSAILFCLFDKFDRGFKGSHVLNSQKTSFKCKLEFEISGTRYFIERNGSTTRSGNVKVDVDFWKIVNGEKQELHGNARRDTNDIIRDYVGTYEDFIQTAASFEHAKDSTPFIDMGNSDRKDLLVQFIGLNIFDRLQETANERNKEINTILKLHKERNYSFEIQQNQNLLTNANILIDKLNTEILELKSKLLDINNNIILESSNLIKLDDNIPTNISILNSSKIDVETTLKNKTEKLKELTQSILKQEKEISDIDEKIKKIELSNLVENHKIYKKLTDKIISTKQKIDIKKIEIKSKLDKVSRLDKHEYNPECKYCNNNSFVKDAIKAKKELIEDKVDTDNLITMLSDQKSEAEKYKWVEKTYDTYTKLLTDRSKFKDDYSIISKNTLTITNDIEKLDTILKSTTAKIELYYKNKISVESNEQIQKKILDYRIENKNFESEYQRKNESLLDMSGKRELFKNQILTLTTIIDDIIKLENESDAYKQYLITVGRDGIPYQVICNAVPQLEKEVNAILSPVVDYTIQFETDGKNIIPYVVYEYGKWPIELTSGYERFVASIAIRVGLTNISSLPKTNFLAIDEGWSKLDPENLSSMNILFSILKHSYDFIFVISHVDSIKDMVDKRIEITREGNFSAVIYE